MDAVEKDLLPLAGLSELKLHALGHGFVVFLLLLKGLISHQVAQLILPSLHRKPIFELANQGQDALQHRVVLRVTQSLDEQEGPIVLLYNLVARQLGLWPFEAVEGRNGLVVHGLVLRTL